MIKNNFDLSGSFGLLVDPSGFSIGFDSTFSLQVSGTYARLIPRPGWSLDQQPGPGGGRYAESEDAVQRELRVLDHRKFPASGQHDRSCSDDQQSGFAEWDARGACGYLRGSARRRSTVLGAFVAQGTFDFSYNTSSGLSIHAAGSEALGPLGSIQVAGDLTVGSGVYGDLAGTISTSPSLSGVHFASIR